MKKTKRAISTLLAILMVLSCVTVSFSVIASAATDYQIQNAANDPSTASIESKFKTNGEYSSDNDGRVETDKTVQYGGDAYSAFSSYEDDEFSVTMSALSQAYTKTTKIPIIEFKKTEKKVHADVVFVLDVSGSMGRYYVNNDSGSTEKTRAEGTVDALNSAISEMMENDPETRFGIVSFGNHYYGTDGVYLPIDSYSLAYDQTAWFTYGGSVTPMKTAATTKTGSNTSLTTTKTSLFTANGTTYYARRNSSSGSNIRIYRGSSTSYTTLTSSSSTYTYEADGVTITRTGNRAVSFSYISSSGTVATTPSEITSLYTETTAKKIATNGCITNSSGNLMSVTSYTVDNDGTFTQAGLKAAENMFATVTDTADRVPVVVLISDGTPTFYDTDYVNVPFIEDSTSGGGDGSSAKGGNGNVNNCTNQMGYLTIRTAMSVKEKVNAMYPDQIGLFYSIGPGVDYLFGQTVLDPSEEHLNSCNGDTTTNTQSGNGTPDGLRTMLLEKLTTEELDYVDYADWAITGEMSSSELTTAFQEIITNITDIPRPVVIFDVEEQLSVGESVETDTALMFTDTLGDGMQVTTAPVVRYNNTNYTSTGSTTTRNEDGSIVVRYLYSAAIQEPSTGKLGNLSDLTVNVITDKDGKQTVKWYIPSNLVPAIYPNISTTPISYREASPIRLIYKVGIADKTVGGTYYTNSTAQPANSTYTPTEANPYYYTASEDGSTAVIDYTATSTNKTQNTTNTRATSQETAMDSTTGQLTAILGNNGVETIRFTTYTVTKVWDDSSNKYNLRPDSIFVQLYRNGTKYRSAVEITASNATVSADGNTWTYTFTNLPYVDGDVYTVTENGVDNYSTTISGGTITNTLDVKLNPDVVILDYGKTINSDPLANDNGDYVIDGITKNAPANGTNTTQSVKLTNGVATVTSETVGAGPVGTDVVSPFTLSGTQYVYPIRNGGTVLTEDSSLYLRYSVTEDGAIVKYPANSTTGTTLCTSLDENGGYVLDGDYAFCRQGNTLYVVTGYSEKVVTNYVTQETIDDITEHVSVTTTKTQFYTYNDTPLYTYYTLDDGDIYSIYIYYGDYLACTSVSETDAVTSNGMTFRRTGKTGFDFIYQGTVVKQVPQETKTLRVKNSSANCVTYTPFQYMSSIDRIYYYVALASKPTSNSNSTDRLYSTVSYVPATTVYYEDDFGGSADNGGLYIQYTGDWYTITDDGTKTSGITANTDTTDRQDDGEVGDNNVPYGYDSSYDDCIKFSNGSAATVNGTTSIVDGKRQFDAKASFTFTGTGFDIISRTDLDCGMLSVMIYNHDDGTLVKTVPVLNKGTNTLYQIPCISYEGLDYGTYDVVINVCAKSTALGYGNVFYLDAIRIYNPMGLESSDNDEFDEANSAYYIDKEANAYVASIRDYVIQAADLDPTEESGAVYVDTINNEYNSGGTIGNIKSPDFTDEEKRTRSMDPTLLDNLELIGPNEEMYLSPGYGVGFIIESTIIPESIQLEIKVPTPINDGASLTAQTYGNEVLYTFEVNSAAEMFYDITKAVDFTYSNGKYRATVILSNGLPTDDLADIVSITNLKMTFAENIEVQSADDADLITTASVDEEVATVALKASTDMYMDVFDTVYVQHTASLPDYDIVNAEADETATSGTYASLTFNSSNTLDSFEIYDENGKQVQPTAISTSVDESKLYTEDYQNAKTWFVRIPVSGEGEQTFTIKAVGGEGDIQTVTIDVQPTEITSLKVVSKPNKTQYSSGEEINTAGLVLEATYSDGSVVTVRSGYSIDTQKASGIGVKTINVSFDGAKTSFRIQVKTSFSQMLKNFFSFSWLKKR